MIEVVTAGLDWLTLTLPLGARLDQQFVHKSLECIDSVVSDGYELQYRSLLGYEGVGAGGCFVGSRADGHMAQFSGRYADAFFDKVYRYDAHVSRLDIQVTVKYKVMPKGIAKEAYRDATTENQTIPVGRRRKLWIIVGSDGGDTAYIGSQSSDQRGRIYNKEVQSEDPTYSRCWRYEVVLKNGQATTTCRSLQAQTTNRPDVCSAYVGLWFQKRGIQTPWLFDETIAPLPPVKTLPTDIERKLNWLAHQVRPTIEYLLTVREKESILQLLGLS